MKRVSLWPAGLILGLLTMLAPAAEAFRVTAPAEGAILKSRQELTVTVELGTELGMRRVQYYWYRDDEEPLVEQQSRPALVATAASSPPYGGTLIVPADAYGTMRLLAVGEVARGRLAGREEFDEVLVQVEPAAALTGIEFEVEKPWRLETLGKIAEIPVIGQFADGVARRIGGASAGSVYRSTNEQVIKVYPNGLCQVLSNGKAQIIVTNKDRQGALDVVVVSTGEANRAPTADAGPDLTVKAGSRVVLSALRSHDPDGDPLSYQWSQIRGHKVSLLDADTARATFLTPKVSAKRLLRFKLRVTDMRGPDTIKGADSFPAFVNVWVEP